MGQQSMYTVYAWTAFLWFGVPLLSCAKSSTSVLKRDLVPYKTYPYEIPSAAQWYP